MIPPAAMVIAVDVTDAPNGIPMPKVPAVDADQPPAPVTAVDPAVEKVSAPEFVLLPDPAAFHEVACRA